MRIGISTFGADGGKSGISRYLVRLLEEWHRAGVDHDIELVGLAEDEVLFRPRERGWRWTGLGRAHAQPVFNLMWHQVALPALCERRQWDLLFLPAANRRIVSHAACPVVGTVHDLASMHLGAKYDPFRTCYIRHLLPRRVQRLTRVLTVSESSRRDLVEKAGVDEDKIEVVPLGADLSHLSCPVPRDEARRVCLRYGVEGPFLLYVSRIEHPGKNHVRLIEAFELLKARNEVPHRLVFVGSDWSGAEEVHRRVERSPVREQICFTGFAPDQDLPALYGSADGFVFPSCFEGFGLPILEAMAAGIPTACSNVSSMPEVAGDSALLFDPSDVEEMAQALCSLVGDARLRSELAERGKRRASEFRWSDTAERTMEILEDSARRSQSRARIAAPAELESISSL
jgi:glycosyltransferase involved in cell wall biosynthesis